MERCMFFLLLLLLGREGASQNEEICSKTAINSCGDCISSGRYCVWCKQLDFTKPGEQDAARCDTKSLLKERGCREDEIISPVSNISVVKDAPLSASFTEQEPIQLSPQEINLKLRPGLPTTFTVLFKRVQGYPVDLYYLMDLSNSMKDDLENVKKLGADLFKALRKVTERAQIGFGAFVDKTVLPFTNTNKDKLLRPCEEEDKFCQAAFGYRHVVSITEDVDKFIGEVNKQYISGNLDSPEGSLDAMMQAAVCSDQIGWRNSSTRLLVLTTDDAFHMAGDGKLAGILEPNDEKCHLGGDGLYVKSNVMDYPSVGQLAAQLEKNRIQPIFAVTQNMETVYTQLRQMIPKSEVRVLNDNSDNVVDLIDKAYKSLSSKVELSHDDLPEGVKVTYTPINCDSPGQAGETTGVCEGVVVGKQISFEVTVTAANCMTEPSSFYISPLGINAKLKVAISTHCECDCNDSLDDKNGHCDGNGQVTCGTCKCNTGFVGGKCECATGANATDESALKASCRKNGTLTECEGRGDCECGRCLCYNLEQGGSSYYGDFCQCDDEHCEKYLNKLCGGNGKCRCDKCECDEGFEGDACQCPKSDERCRLQGNVCSGRGKCKCNQCECDNGYQRPFCQECHSCEDYCVTKKDCIECLAYDNGPLKKNCTKACTSVVHKVVDTFTTTFTTTKKQCKQKDSQNCWMFYNMIQLDGPDSYSAEVKPFETRECPELPNIYAIIGGSIAGVALIGLLLLMLIKGLIFLNDRKEFKKFENEKKKSKWAEADNPLFKDATTTTANPMFTGGEE